MFAGRNKKSVRLGVVAGFAVLASCSLAAGQGEKGKRPFTVEDDIAYVHFPSGVDAYSTAWNGAAHQGIQFSPDGEFFAVISAHGNLKTDQVEESLRFYRTKDVENYLRHSGQPEEPAAEWVVKRSAKEESIVSYQWLVDSSTVALREQTGELNDRVILLDLRNKSEETLPFGVGLQQRFEITDREHYIYSPLEEAWRKEVEQKQKAEREAPIRAFAGDVWDILEPDNLWIILGRISPKRKVWAAAGGPPFELKYNGVPLADSDVYADTLVLSPDGQSAVTKLRNKNIPATWERLYVPSYPSDPNNHIHAGGSAGEFVLLDLKSGTIRHLTNAPAADDGGWWWASGIPHWSRDGAKIVLPGTFLESRDGKPSRPCVAVVDIVANERSCVEVLKGRKGAGGELEEGYRNIYSAYFVGGKKDPVQIEIKFGDANEMVGTEEFRQATDGQWRLVKDSKGYSNAGPNGLEVKVQEAFNEPPVLVASREGASRVIWDPNPQFKDIDLGTARVYTWKNKDGRDWKGGLYLPRGYEAGKRYPLVIQTHGFTESTFMPAGSYPTAYAARELAGAGIAVLQVGGGDKCGGAGDGKVTEAACEVAGFESGARQLASDGVIDLEKVGYIGFSRSCMYGMEMLTNGSLRLKAAFLDDGIMADYFQSALYQIDFKAELGVKPFGDGLEEWVKRSPGFHLDKIRAPVLLGTGRGNFALEMWQPYTGLRTLNKPVEMDIFNTDEHPITNPVERLANQGLSVEWFRFWLQGHEDASAAKAEQYKRWRGLRELQAENDKKAAAQQAALH